MLNQYSSHIGIVNFFPVMFGLIENEEQARASLRVLADSNQMLSPTGVRSLSKLDQFYLYKSNYWRGAVWINVNFLVLRGLFTHYLPVTGLRTDDEPLASINRLSADSGLELYRTLRQRLISAVYKNWRINGVFWEQYSDSTSLGLMTHPFNGWTSLILLVVAETYG
jgi:mannosyl-oligosaccharide glucosidase